MDKNYVEVDGTVLVNLRDDTISSASQIADGVTAHLRTGEKVTGTGGNVLSGKILAVTGDSMCYGVGYSGGYAGIIGTDYGMTVQNIAESGATVAAYQNRWTIGGSISSLRADADYILLEGGGNDADFGITLGSISSGFTATLDTSTFAGAMENMLKSAILRFPGKKLGYILVHKCVDGFLSTDGANSYYGIAKAACEKWGVSVCDLNILVPPVRYMDALVTDFTVDGLHLNEDGYRQLYVPKIVAWMKTL